MTLIFVLMLFIYFSWLKALRYRLCYFVSCCACYTATISRLDLKFKLAQNYENKFAETINISSLLLP